MSRFTYHIDSLLPGRNFGLDVMRASAIMMVVIGHCYHFFEPWFPKIHRLAFVTGNGVELFFSLSGFLIGGILIRQMKKDNHFDIISLFSFWAKRWMRTIPFYYLAIVISWLLVMQFHSGPIDLNWRYFFFVHTWKNAAIWFFPASYSLSIEEWFYLIVPALMWATMQKPRGLRPPNNIYMSCFLVLAWSLCFRYVGHHQYPGHWDDYLRKGTVFRLDACLYGVILAVVFEQSKSFMLKMKSRLLVIGIALYIGTMLVKYWYPESVFTYVWYFTLIPSSFALMIPFFYDIRMKNRAIVRAVTFLSITSYAVYLFHLAPFNEIVSLYTDGKSLATVCSIVFGYLAFTFLWSWLWYRYIETPILKLRKKL